MADKLSKAVTYNELSTLINSSGLHVGEKLILTFRNTYYLLNGEYGSGESGSPISNILDEDENPIIITGSEEHLILTASSSNTLEKIAFSKEYPQDIIEYDWNPANWVNNLNFSIEGTVINGFCGVIHHRIDTLLNNEANHDFRTSLTRVFNVTQPTWQSGIYASGSFVTYNDGDGKAIWYSNEEIIDEEPSVSPKWIKILRIEDNPYLSYNSGIHAELDYSIPIIDDQDYIDKNTFADGCSNCHIYKHLTSDVLMPFITIGENCSCLNIGDQSMYILVGSDCNSINIGSQCSYITFSNYNAKVTIGNESTHINFNYNISEDITIGHVCSNITFGNDCWVMSIGHNCHSIKFGNNCSDMSIGHNCSNITYGASCMGMYIGSGCGDLVFPYESRYVHVNEEINGVNFETELIDLSGVFHKFLFCNYAGVVNFMYYDALNSPIITATSGSMKLI